MNKAKQPDSLSNKRSRLPVARFRDLSLNHFLSSSLNISPHSGQNLGGFEGSDGSQPHLSHLYFGESSGLGEPHSEQNFPLFTFPHEHFQPISVPDGIGAPHSEQNFPIFTLPHLHVQDTVAEGFALPQFLQNLPVFSVPHEHFHASAEADAAC